MMVEDTHCAECNCDCTGCCYGFACIKLAGCGSCGCGTEPIGRPSSI